MANTYHLMLRPGEKLIKKMGGLHGFMGWDGPIMTDSGGFQVFSLEGRITEEGVIFQSHLDGSKHFLGPENSIQIQKDLGTDLIVAFDDHESAKQNHEEVKKSLELTNRWALRSLKELSQLSHPPGGIVSAPVLYGVIHGSTFEDLRIKTFLSEKYDDHLFDGVEAGIDFFDCVAPTRRARNGSLYTGKGLINIRSSRYKADPKPIDPGCNCYTCQNFSRSYLHHLCTSKELTYHSLATFHNLYFINNLMKKIREAIVNKQFKKFKAQYKSGP